MLQVEVPEEALETIESLRFLRERLDAAYLTACYGLDMGIRIAAGCPLLLDVAAPNCTDDLVVVAEEIDGEIAHLEGE